MIRIAEKELVVNQQMRMQLECESSETELFVFDPEWGVYTDSYRYADRPSGEFGPPQAGI